MTDHPRLQQQAEPRFLADSMLGGLARWLRALGYDAAWEPAIADPELVRRGVEEGRWILTRDRGVAERWRVDNVVLLRADDPLRQLGELEDRVELRHERLFSRCTRCNLGLHPAPPERQGDLPPDVRRRDLPASECPGCRRLYWEGSHAERMRRSLQEALRGRTGE
jgi:uncharacterized protein with PIN domain